MGSVASSVRKRIGPLRSVPKRAARSIWNQIGFFHIHLFVFFVVSLIAGIIIYFIERGYTKSDFLDCWFTAVSSLCVTGLIAIDMASMAAATQVVMWFCMLLGGTVIASMAPVLIRWTYFRRHVAESQAHSRIKFPVARALVGLSRQEYRALTKLLIIIPLYVFFFCFVGGVIVFAYGWGDPFTYNLIQTRNINFWWFGAFHSVAAFNNAGFTLLSDSLIPFMQSPGLLVILAILIVAGNVGFPILLRGFLVLFEKVAAVKHKKVFRFLLDHPRLCFVYLFPHQQTVYLIGVLLAFTCLQWFMEMGLDWELQHFSSIPAFSRAIVAFFQAVSTRTAGFNAFDLSLSSPAIQVVYLVMMYISSYPVALSARTSTVKAGVVRPEDEENSVYHVSDNRGGKNNVKYQAKNLIFRDVSYLFIGLLIISIVEDDKLSTDPGITLFKVFFELVSAYGTVGLTLGYPGSVLSLCGTFRPLSKLVIIIVMLLGRHRGLPLSIDHAVNYRSAIAVDITKASNKHRHSKSPFASPIMSRQNSERNLEHRHHQNDRDLESAMAAQVAMSPMGTRRVTVDVADIDRRKTRDRGDSF